MKYINYQCIGIYENIILLYVFFSVVWEVFSEGGQTQQDSCRTFWVAILNHNLAKNFSRVQPFKSIRTSDTLVTSKAAIVILHGKQDIHRILTAFAINQFRNVA